MTANHKRVYRLYCEEGLAVRIRQRRRIRWSGTAFRPAADRPNQRWSTFCKVLDPAASASRFAQVRTYTEFLADIKPL
jgi:hypothetical protein